MTGKKNDINKPLPVSGKLKTGRRPKTVKTYSSGQVLFSEGEIGHELFLISDGEVIVTHGTKEDRVELARLKAGDIIGEMALLDNLPRSATVTTTKDTKTIITSEAAIYDMLQDMPMWLSSVVKIIIARLRNKNKYLGTAIMRNREKSVARLLLMRIEEECPSSSQKSYDLDYYNTVLDICFVTRLQKRSVTKILNILSKKKLLSVIQKAENKFIRIQNIEYLRLFLDYQAQKDEGNLIPVLTLSDYSRKVLEAIFKSPLNVPTGSDGSITIPASSLLHEVAKKVNSVSMDALHELIHCGLLETVTDNKDTKVEMIKWEPDVLHSQLRYYTLFKAFVKELDTSPDNLDIITVRIEKRKAEKRLQKPGVVPNTRFERFYKSGDILFDEGDSGSEMYIVKTGTIQILKQEGTRQVELARLGPGTVLGEMSLLDNAPRSATARAIEDVIVTFIDQSYLQTTLESIPADMKGLIQVVVRRLRETTSNNYLNIIRNGIAPVVRSIFHYATSQKAKKGEPFSLPVNIIKEEAFSLFGLNYDDTEKILAYLKIIKLGNFKDETDTSLERLFVCLDVDVLMLLYSHLRTHRLNKKTLAEQVSKRTEKFARIIYEAGRTRGSKSDKRVKVDVRQVRIHMEQNQCEFTELDEQCINELQKLHLIEMEQKTVQTKNGKSTVLLICYTLKQLPLLIKQLQWRKSFEFDIAQTL
ncbi:MAG: cyclic nucleotide-binding domain-containing protein [Fibrobacteria bacterium]|nr:cyclic nucleotide-binding domain-containing protein [Fibrobacteria bacterium]